MLRDLLTSRAILAGLAFFVLVVVGTELYSWHVRRTGAAELQRTIQALQALKNRNAAYTSQAPETRTPTAEVQIDRHNTGPQIADDTAAFSDEAERADTSLPDNLVSEETPAAEVPVSPYGFGPYPEVPSEMPADTFPSPSADHELIARVRIKLLAEGINARGVNMENDWVYPVIPGIAYVKWEEYERPDGVVRYISDLLAHPSDGLRIDAIREEKGRAFTEADIPSDIKLMSFEEGAIDPYRFLGLQRQ